MIVFHCILLAKFPLCSAYLRTSSQLYITCGRPRNEARWWQCWRLTSPARSAVTQHRIWRWI